MRAFRGALYQRGDSEPTNCINIYTSRFRERKMAEGRVAMRFIDVQPSPDRDGTDKEGDELRSFLAGAKATSTG